MTGNFKELRSLLRADILDHPDKLEKLAHCVYDSVTVCRNAYDSGNDSETETETETENSSSSPYWQVLDAFVESNILRILTIPRGDALRVIGALVEAYQGLHSLICEVIDIDRLAKALYDILHVKTPQGLVEDLAEEEAVYSVLDPFILSGYGETEANLLEACTRHGLIEAFESGLQACDLFDPVGREYHRTVTWDEELLILDECKARFDRAREGKCSLDKVQRFFSQVWVTCTQSTFRHPKELVGFKLETHPLIIAEMAYCMLRHHKNVLGDIFSVWPDVMEQIVDAILEWPRLDNLDYWASLEFIRHCLREPTYAKRFSEMGSTKAIAVMNLIKALPCPWKMSYWNQFGVPLILTMVKYTPDLRFRVQLIIYPWHEVLGLQNKFLAEFILASLFEAEIFKHCPKYILLVAAHLLKALLSSMEQDMKKDKSGVFEETKCVPYYDKTRAALKIFEELGAFEHDFAQKFPDICEPGALKSFMLENCEKFAEDYVLYES